MGQSLPPGPGVVVQGWPRLPAAGGLAGSGGTAEGGGAGKMLIRPGPNPAR